jgi:two-component system sensor kinase FixL
MSQQNQPFHHPNEPISAMLPNLRPSWRDLAIFFAGYIALDWASYIHPLHDLNITPWNPAPALGLVYLLRIGSRMVLPMATAIFAAEWWVRGLPVGIYVTLAIALLLTFNCWLLALLLHRALAGGRIFFERRGLLLWSVGTTGGMLVNSLLLMGLLNLTNHIPDSGWADSVFQYWVGDATGALVAMPLVWSLMEPERRRDMGRILLKADFLITLGLVTVALWVAFVPGSVASFKYFYVLFLPIAWAASRDGLPGAVISATLIQLGLITGFQWLDIATVTVVETQALSVVIAVFGFFIGVVVDEKQRVSDELRETLRLAAAAEMAGALAHELNQPLSALSTYGAACETLLEMGETGDRLRDAVRSMTRESTRAAEVLRRLRDFFRTGSTQLEPLALAALLQRAITPFQASSSVSCHVNDVPPCWIMGDRLQLEVVLRNLLSNAVDAADGSAADGKAIRVSAVLNPHSRGVTVMIEDNGAGFDDAGLARLFASFQSTKSSGLGLGLVISRAIVEAHGGQLWAEAADHGIFKLYLPLTEESEHAP